VNRDEHLRWCKRRANEYLDRGDVSSAINSFLSDCSKHPETANIPLHPMCHPMVRVVGDSVEEARKFINGWN
jgi:hypothetical protein